MINSMIIPSVPQRGRTIYGQYKGDLEITRTDILLGSVAILAQTMQLPREAVVLSFHSAFTKMTASPTRQPDRVGTLSQLGVNWPTGTTLFE